jgi:hypothetical protein
MPSLKKELFSKKLSKKLKFFEKSSAKVRVFWALFSKKGAPTQNLKTQTPNAHL